MDALTVRREARSIKRFALSLLPPSTIIRESQRSEVSKEKKTVWFSVPRNYCR